MSRKEGKTVYRLEEFKNKSTMRDYMKEFVDPKVFLKYCEACENFGKIWSCPPYAFEPEEYWEKYRYIHILGTKIIFDRQSITEAEMADGVEKYVKRTFFKVKQLLAEKMEAMERNYPGVSLSAGNCNLCRKCTRDSGDGCRYPDRMRYSIESLGGDVVGTAKELLGIEVQWADSELPEYLVLVNGFLTDEKDLDW
jgi:predicted metal-binding protein